MVEYSGKDIDAMLRQHPGGISLSVRVSPKSRRVGIHGVHDAALKVGVSAAPEGGKATEEVREVLARSLGVRLSQVELVSGATSRQKVFRISGVPLELLRVVLQRALAGETAA